MSIRICFIWVVGILALSSLTGCDMVNGWLGTSVGEADGSDQTDNTDSTLPVNNSVDFNGEVITIGTFNIQVFGVDKMQDQAAIETVVKIIRHFDVIAIQELRAKDQSVIPELVNLVNAPGYGFNYIVGPRQGRTNSKEQYVFLYDTNRVQLIDQPFMVPDPNDLIHREPMVARFRCLTNPGRNPFTFMLMNIHTDPDETRQELNALVNSVEAAYQQYSNSSFGYEDDLIVLGDFNENPNEFFQFGQIPGFTAVIPADVTTNVSRTKCYDNLVFDARTTTEFLNKADVFDFERDFNLSRESAKNVSDHLPVWACFSIYENEQTDIATRPTTNFR